MSEPRKIGRYIRANTISPFKTEKTCNKLAYFIVSIVAIYVFYTAIQSDLVRNKTSPKILS